MGHCTADLHPTSASACSREVQKGRGWQEYLHRSTGSADVLNEAAPLPLAAEGLLSHCIHQYHTETLTIEDNKQLRLLVQGGIPAAWRRQFWSLSLDCHRLKLRDSYASNHYAKSTSALSACGSCSKLSTSADACNQESSGHRASGVPEDIIDQIEKDIYRTLPKAPGVGDTGVDALRRILMAYARQNPGVGYCQGMNFLVGMLLQHLPEEQTFWGLSHIVESILADYFVESMAGVVADQHICRGLLLQHCPSVMRHADSLQVNLAIVASQWLLTAFVNVLPVETASCVWDVMLFEGSSCVLFRTMLTIVDSNVQNLLACKNSLHLWQMVVSLPGMFDDASLLLGMALLQYQDITEFVSPPRLVPRSLCVQPQPAALHNRYHT
eukprot:jgi/Ulvmu1/7282/UM035_0070.1